MPLYFASGCSNSNSDSEGSTTQSYCSAYEKRLRDCDLITDGEFEACVNYLDAAETCETRCLRSATCDAIESFFCGTTGSVLRCMGACIGVHAFECSDGSEAPVGSQCDGVSDCPDGEDETDCSVVSGYKCRNTPLTIPWEQRCNGTQDCADGSDELPDCNPVLTCDDNVELSVWSYCNGRSECEDGTDEPADCAVSRCQ